MPVRFYGRLKCKMPTILQFESDTNFTAPTEKKKSTMNGQECGTG